MKRIIFYLLIVCVGALAACSDDDSFTTSRQSLLTFSTDTVRLDTVFSTIGSATRTFWVYNHGDEGIRLKSVRLRQGNQTGFRVNVDGSYLDNSLGSVVTDLEVRKGDSLRVFVELTPPETSRIEPQLVEDDLLFQLESGVEQRVCLHSWAWDALQVKDWIVSRDTLVESARPIIVYGGIRIDSAATLTIRNTTLFFHAGEGIDVYGRLIADSVTLRGDRLDHLFDYLPYDRVSDQWGQQGGIILRPSSTGNVLRRSTIRNAGQFGIRCDSAVFDSTALRLDMEHCAVHNCAGMGIAAYNANIRLRHCQITNSLAGCIYVCGGKAELQHCTLAQFYPFSAARGAALSFSNTLDGQDYPLYGLELDSSLLTGYEDEQWSGLRSADTLQPFEYHFSHSLIRAAADDDSLHFNDIIWETPEDTVVQGLEHFPYTDTKTYYYDFKQLDSLSRAWNLLMP